MAKGTVPDESKVSCPACKASLKTGQGYCDHCKVGVLHGVAYSSKADYDAAVKADAILVRAILAANSCEGCAVAMVTDGECSHCKMSFKDGQPKKS
jgi:hypothetical protein